MIRIKICGITNLHDALAAVAAGADALGFIFHPESPRNISREQATAIIRDLPPLIQTVGLFVNKEADFVNTTTESCGLDIVQLHGEETPDFCAAINRRVIKAFRVKDQSTIRELSSYNVSGYLLDAWSPAAHGGTGETFNWEIAAVASADNRRIILAGGLTPENVTAAVRNVKPYAVDVSSGVEALPGRKDTEKIYSFIQKAREADCELSRP